MKKTARAMMFPIRPKWVKKIFDGSKKFEFRNKLPKHLKSGMKIYIYETLGRKHVKKEMGYVMSTTHDGSGMIVGEFTVGDIWYINHNKILKTIGGIRTNIKTCTGRTFNYKDFLNLGYTNQKFAFEITNVVHYETYVPKYAFINWNKMELAKRDLKNDCEFVCDYCPYTNFGEIENKITQFGSCEGVYCEEAYERYLESECDVKSPPQAPIYVVEREGLL